MNFNSKKKRGEKRGRKEVKEKTKRGRKGKEGKGEAEKETELFCIPYIEFQRAYWQEMVENRPTFHTKLLLHSTNRITGYILYVVEPPVRYNSVFQPENAPNTFDVLYVVYVLMASIVCTGIRYSNRQLDPSNLAYHDLKSYKKIHQHTILYIYDIETVIIIVIFIIAIK